MAPAASKTRDNQFFNVGVQGRKTGITLKDTGVRDEYGMEPIDGIFSSPEKSPPKRANARQQDRTLTSSDMDVQQSMCQQTVRRARQPRDSLVDELLASDEDTKTAPPNTGSMPDPADALSARRSIRPNRSSIFPPPMGRSPIKTALGSSPRRQSSMGPPSAMRRSSRTPDRAMTQPAVARRLDFNAMDEDNAKVNGSGSRNRGKPRPDVFALPVSPARGKKRIHESIVDEETMLEESELQVNGVGADSPLPAGGDESLQMLEDDDATVADEEEDLQYSTEIAEPEPEPELEPTPPPPPPKAHGKARRSSGRPEATAPVLAPKKAQGRPKAGKGLVSAKSSNAAVPARSRVSAKALPNTNGRLTDEDEMDVDQSIEVSIEEEPSVEDVIEEELEEEPEETLEPEPEPEPKPKPATKKRGRPKAGKLEVHKDESQESVELPERPAKKAKKAPAPKKPPPSQRDPNARITSKNANPKGKEKAKQKEDMPPPLKKDSFITSESRSQSRAASQPRSLQVLRQGTPFEDAGARTTRSGRISAKPVEFWRNERIEYAHDGTKKEIVRAEDIDEPKRPGRHTTSRKRTNKKSVSVIEEEEELEPEDWEVNEGVLHGFVNGWDEKNHAIIDEGARPEELAYSAARLQTKEVAGATFRYAKIVGLPYFGAGMVDIPPNGCKRLKNSRRMFMAFCLMFGKVTVTVGDSEFSISKGGVWMVPRGE
ncbi:mitotic fidelity of chromosome transmission-related protein [Neofusicoccum ribis]|uniref:Mitotic fidelity of chromosome transmission-related protein n=1 Tax=Neofusicoccum ribis TaxID=45134 RepID=A0ABR3SJ54_9PEZI